MMADLEHLFQSGFFSSLEYRFANMLARISKESDPQALLGAAVALYQTRFGHVCADLEMLGNQSVMLEDGTLLKETRWPDATTWRRSLAAGSLVSSGDRTSPLVLDNKGRLYLHQYYQKESKLADLLLSRAAAKTNDFDATLLEKDLTALFGSQESDAKSGQRIAAETAVRRRLTVITGGPGAGKTTVVLGMLLLIIRQFQHKRGLSPKIEVLAPTGKAARRLGEVILHAKNQFAERLGKDGQQAASALPERASTIHRVLRNVHRSTPNGEVGSKGLLSADAVVIDEASMVDLSLMHDLFQRIKADARVIIVGDKDQLASVESGAVLADIFEAATAEHAELRRSAVHLTGSFRFGPSGGIGRLARAVNAGDEDEVLSILKNDPSGELTYVPATSDDHISKTLCSMVKNELKAIFAAPDAASLLEALGRFRVLTPHRIGPLGQQSLNRRIEELLVQEKVIVQDQLYYIGRPVMVTKNDYAAQLFNGDVGIVTVDPNGRRAVAFADESGVRFISPARLSDVETVHVMTVHKSQGSEFDKVAVILPERLSPLMVRELLYTAVTRARSHLVIIGPEPTIRHAVSTVTRRFSGLKDRLLSGRIPIA